MHQVPTTAIGNVDLRFPLGLLHMANTAGIEPWTPRSWIQCIKHSATHVPYFCFVNFFINMEIAAVTFVNSWRRAVIMCLSYVSMYLIGSLLVAACINSHNVLGTCICDDFNAIFFVAYFARFFEFFA